MSEKIYVVGIGPGDASMMTDQAKEILEKSDVIVGYTVYLDLIREQYSPRPCPRERTVGASPRTVSPEVAPELFW